MKHGTMMKRRGIFLQSHAQGQGQLSKSKALNSNKQRTNWYLLMKVTTVLEKNKRHLSARSHQGQGQCQLSRSKTINFDN
jgi:hypothetical protein